MHPEWRLVGDLDDQGREHHEEAGTQDDEDRRAVAGIREGIIQPAFLAAWPQFEKAGEHLALAAARAAAGEAGNDGRGRLCCHLAMS